LVAVSALKAAGSNPVGVRPPSALPWKVKQIGDCSNLENCRGVKALGSSTLPPSVSSLLFSKFAIMSTANSREIVRSQISYSRSLYLFIMSEMTNRTEVVNVLTSRVIENAPLRELIRVYSEAVQAAIGQLSDDDVIRSIAYAGYTDILEAFELTVPEATEEAPAEEAAA
jgi:hypothetical protein